MCSNVKVKYSINNCENEAINVAPNTYLAVIMIWFLGYPDQAHKIVWEKQFPFIAAHLCKSADFWHIVTLRQKGKCGVAQPNRRCQTFRKEM